MHVLPEPQLHHLVRTIGNFFKDQVHPLAIATFATGATLSHDKGAGDLVGVLDLQVQERLLGLLPNLIPGANIVSEESIGNGNLRDGTVWLLDPIDGTNTMLSGIPIFGSQLCLLIEGEVVFTAVYLPTEVLFDKPGFVWASRSSGTWEQATDGPRRLSISSTAQLGSATLLLEGPSKGLMASPIVHALSASVRRTRSVQAACWSMTLIARGSQYPAASADLLLALDNKPWDNLPACLLVEEAGGRVTDLEGGPWSVDNNTTLLFSNGLVHDDALSITRSRVAAL